MVRLSVVPVTIGRTNMRQRYPFTFLNDEETVSTLHNQVSQLPGEGKVFWQSALVTITRSPHRFEFQNKTTGLTEVRVLLMESTGTRLTPQAWHCLWSNGYKHVRDPAAGCSALNFLAQQQHQDRLARQFMEKPRSVIHDSMTRPLKRKTHEVWRLVKRLKNKRKLQ